MLRIGCLGWGLLFVVGCSDDGHVVGEMQTDGGGGTAAITASSDDGTVTTGTTGSDGDVSTGTASGTATSGGGAGAAGGSTSATTQASTGSGGSGAANSSGGTAGADASSGGTSGASGETATSTSGSDLCPPDQIWCPGCEPGEGICSAGGCPGVACPSCSDITTEEECEVTVGCHAVFNDPETCGCLALGCCARFAFCAPGSRANCEGPVTCASAAPYCSEPMYVPSYVNDCIEGCVRPEVCAD